MEQHKHRALLYFLKRSNKPLERYVDALIPVVQELKDAYEELDLEWQQDTEAFLKLMILDGCFILELLLATTSTSARSLQVYASKDDRARNDPIFSDHGRLYLVSHLKRDMLMLENQIPILVLQRLFHVAFNEESYYSVKDNVARLILMFFSQPSFDIVPFCKCLHILDMYRMSLILEDPRRINVKAYPHRDIQVIIPSATELKEAGIRFKRSKSRSLRDISFYSGILELPLIVVNDALESLFLNMIAFERFHVGLTSYICFMDNLIDISTDVSLLESSGIIQNALGSDKSAANLFNSLSTGITLGPGSNLGVVHKQVSKYCQKSRSRWRAYLMDNYYNFTNPRELSLFR